MSSAAPTNTSSVLSSTRRLPSICDTISANLERWLVRQKIKRLTRSPSKGPVLLGSLSLSLADTESVQQNETQRVLNASLSHSHRDMDLGHQSSETVANDAARASVTCFQYYWQTCQICSSSDCCPQAISRNGVEGFSEIEQETWRQDNCDGLPGGLGS